MLGLFVLYFLNYFHYLKVTGWLCLAAAIFINQTGLRQQRKVEWHSKEHLAWINRRLVPWITALLSLSLGKGAGERQRREKFRT